MKRYLLLIVLLLASGCAHAPPGPEWTVWCGYEEPVYGSDC